MFRFMEEDQDSCWIHHVHYEKETHYFFVIIILLKSFDILLEWHRRIENVSYPLPVNNENECYPPLNQFVIGVHQIHTENSR